jgi:HSP20 family protein
MTRLTRYNRRSPLVEMNRALERMQNWVDRTWPFNDEELPFDGEHMAINMRSENGQIVVNAALPGIKEDEIQIDLQGDVLTISAERKTEREETSEEKNWHYRELSWGKTMRRVHLPQEVNMEKAEATLQDGILTVSLPTAQPSPAHKIAVKAKNLIKSGDKK